MRKYWIQVALVACGMLAAAGTVLSQTATAATAATVVAVDTAMAAIRAATTAAAFSATAAGTAAMATTASAAKVRKGMSASFNCGCNGSYKFPVPPLYTYHWPGSIRHSS